MFDTSKKCPYFKKPCLKHDCTHYIALRGADPQTGAALDEWGCAIVWGVVAQLEGNKESRQTAAAIESFRNEMVRGQRAALLMESNNEDVKTAIRLQQLASGSPNNPKTVPP